MIFRVNSDHFVKEQLNLIMEMCCVSFEVRTELLNANFDIQMHCDWMSNQLPGKKQ
jgi:hypothetical protein